MTGPKPPNVSIANPLGNGKLHSPSADRNVGPLCDLLAQHAPQTGEALEIASGTGQHVVAFARLRPRLTWQPTEIAPERRASIDIWAAESGLANIRPAQFLDATRPGWASDHSGKALVSLCNLMHLIATEQARIVIDGAVSALAPGGRFLLYGPFLRDGKPASRGDADFDAHIREFNPTHGYKNDRDIENWLRAAGAREVTRHAMPANNLAFIATR